jgi:hypothetical protein
VISSGSNCGEFRNRFYDSVCGDVRDRCFSILIEEARRFGDGQLTRGTSLVPDVEYSMAERLAGLALSSKA